jgi:divalent metal cation (Fe/Co/Zn/Cd) transporter
MMAESVHSFLDCSNGLILLWARKGSEKADKHYPLGRDRELFFWAFVVSLLLFSAGGLFNVYEGVRKFSVHDGIGHPVWGIAVLLLSMAAEIYSLRACFKEIDRKESQGSFWTWVRQTANADLLVMTLINIASVAGLLIALASLITNWATGEQYWDAVGSFIIGLLLITTALVIAREMKSLLIGEATAYDYQTPVEAMLREFAPDAHMLHFMSMQRGMGKVLMAYKIDPGSGALDRTQDAIAMTNRLEDAVQERYPEVKWQFVKLDTRADAN